MFFVLIATIHTRRSKQLTLQVYGRRDGGGREETKNIGTITVVGSRLALDRKKLVKVLRESPGNKNAIQLAMGDRKIEYLYVRTGTAPLASVSDNGVQLSDHSHTG